MGLKNIIPVWKLAWGLNAGLCPGEHPRLHMVEQCKITCCIIFSHPRRGLLFFRKTFLASNFLSSHSPLLLSQDSTNCHLIQLMTQLNVFGFILLISDSRTVKSFFSSFSYIFVNETFPHTERNSSLVWQFYVDYLNDQELVRWSRQFAESDSIHNR